MGSITAIFLIPFLSFFAVFLGFYETIAGIGTEKVVLPYDPQNGVVWEYQEGDEAYIDCIDTEIKDDQQIFTFRGKRIFDKNRPTSTYYENEALVDDIYFEDDNGNTKKYYAFLDFRVSDPKTDSATYGSIDIYEETECASFQYTAKAQKELEDCYWHVYDSGADLRQNRYIGEYKLENVHERTYRFVFPPEDIKDHSFNMTFVYRDSQGKQFEKLEVEFEMIGKEVKVIEETFYVNDENGIFVNQNTNEPFC